MISRRSNYNYLLDNLKRIYNNKEKDNKNQRIIVSKYFCYLYCLAYKKTMLNNNSISQIDDIFEVALSDYNTFNSFINNCVNEYRIYNSVGTGNIMYIPYQMLANNFFDGDSSKSILIDYLNIELENIITIEGNKIYIK